MINKEFFKQVDEIAIERELNKDDIYEIMKKAFEKAYQKVYGLTSCRVQINPERSEINLYQLRLVVNAYSLLKNTDGVDEILIEDASKLRGNKNVKVGQIIEIPVSIKDLGRLGATVAKQTYNNSIKSLEREKAYEYFKSLEGEMINATVTDTNENYIFLSIGRNIHTILPLKELLPNDDPKTGDYLKVFIRKVEPTTRDPKVLVSRNDRNLINRLLETYIPEIGEGIIEVKGIARDPGDRTKIAVFSNDPNVDAIGSCVGEGGTRIKEIVDALNGEKIDLYKWSENIPELIANSLQPAQVTKVLSVDPKTKSSIVIVPDDQLSLAIGKQGQNVRLAVQSCGWKIDIKSLKDAFDEGLIELS